MSDIITSGLDQSPTTLEDIDAVLGRIDELIEKSIKAKDPYVALNEAKNMRKLASLSSWFLAKLLYMMHKHWDEYGVEDRFEDVVFSWVGLHHDTVIKYVRIWSLFAENLIPEYRKPQLLQRNIKDVVQIANAIHQGVELEDDDWDKISDTVDFNSLSEVMRSIKGQRPRDTALRIFMDEIGTLWVYHKDQKYFVGSLEVAAKEEPIKRAINRIIDNSGILRK